VNRLPGTRLAARPAALWREAAVANELTSHGAATLPTESWPSKIRTIGPPRRLSWRTALARLFLLAFSLYIGAMAARVYLRKYYVFLPDYVRWTLERPVAMAEGPTHLFVLVTDHFEPNRDAERVRTWGTRYAALAERHRDSTGRPPQHTFFYPVEQIEPKVLNALRQLTTAGFGEVEVHYHHDYDTGRSLRPKLSAAIRELQRYGFLVTADGRTAFGFIHGNWGLDNSNGPVMCGVNAELRLLRELGCYGDFTFPSVFEDSQPPFVNTIYAARDSDEPKSYRRKLPLSALEDGSADLMMFQGPLIFAPSLNPRRLFVDLDDGNIHPPVPGSPTRVDRWVRANVHVPGRPDWVFIKLFAHGISSVEDEEAVVGPTFDATLSYLEQRYNDRARYVLHYVTAREAYNLARAASDGAAGDPSSYLDYVIPPYLSTVSRSHGGGGAK
jgi:hypothetical protein